MRGLRAYSAIGEASKLPIQTHANLAHAVSGVLLTLHGSDLGKTRPIDKRTGSVRRRRTWVSKSSIDLGNYLTA